MIRGCREGRNCARIRRNRRGWAFRSRIQWHSRKRLRSDA
jgi:hypothetical protein